MSEDILLALVGGDEPESLVPAPACHCAGLDLVRLLPFALKVPTIWAPNLGRFETTILFHFDNVLDLLPFKQHFHILLLDSAPMRKHILRAIVGSNEAIPLISVPFLHDPGTCGTILRSWHFHCSFCFHHYRCLCIRITEGVDSLRVHGLSSSFCANTSENEKWNAISMAAPSHSQHRDTWQHTACARATRASPSIAQPSPRMVSLVRVAPTPAYGCHVSPCNTRPPLLARGAITSPETAAAGHRRARPPTAT